MKFVPEAELEDAEQRVEMYRTLAYKQRVRLTQEIAAWREQAYTESRRAAKLEAEIHALKTENTAFRQNADAARRDYGKLKESMDRLQREFTHMGELYNAIQGGMRPSQADMEQAKARATLARGITEMVIKFLMPAPLNVPGYDNRRGL